MLSKFYILTIFIFTFLFISSANAATFTVNRADDLATISCSLDANQCSLREAITEANANGAGADIINFAIPGSGAKTINLVSPLPEVNTSLTINGQTQTGYVGKPMIEVNGNGLNSYGFIIDTPQPYVDIAVTIKALAINRHVYGIYSNCFKKCDITLLGNFIGTDPTGTIDLGNGLSGINIYPTNGSVINIGGAGTFEGNLISGNGGVDNSNAENAINIEAQPATPFLDGYVTVNILGNKIGTDFNGNERLENTDEGIHITERSFGGSFHALDITLNIGGASIGARNVISGNDGTGIYVDVTTATIKGNYIGTNSAGTAALGNRDLDDSFGAGIRLQPRENGSYTIGGSQTGEGNVISGNGSGGIDIFNYIVFEPINVPLTIQGNYIGTNAAGTVDLGNDGNGISIEEMSVDLNVKIGGVTELERNVISGNGGDGIFIYGETVSIYGNRIGTDKTGTIDLGNDASGIRLYPQTGDSANVTIGGTIFQFGSNYDAGNLISGNGAEGIKLIANNALFSPVVIKRNRIGTNLGGTSAIPNAEDGIFVGIAGVYIGSETNADDGNLISGNTKHGIHLSGLAENASNARIVGNKIGTNGIGGDFLPNGFHGIYISGAPNNQIGLAGNDTARNIVSGNNASGIVVYGADGNKIENNIIGAGATGNDLGNQENGVVIAQANQTSIGSASGTGNVIAFNQKGVFVESGTGNAIRRNSIYSNDELGIDLQFEGVTPNDAGDADTGANNKQNFPVLSVVNPNNIAGSLNSAPNTSYDLDFYRVDSCDASGYGEGRYLLGSKTVTTDALGNAAFNQLIFLSVGEFVTATATVSGIAKDTSEFSNCTPVTAISNIALSAATYSANESATVRTIVVNRTGGTASTVTVQYATSNGTATAGQDYTATSGTLTFASGEVVKTFDIPIINDTIDEADETINIALSNATAAFLTAPSSAVLTIVDNDTAPTISITDVSQPEGNSGETDFTFHVNLSSASSQNISVNFATANGTASAPIDYLATNGTVNFAAGETDKVVTVSVHGDSESESNESFYVQLTAPTNATIADNQGVALILDDDAAPVSIGGTIRKPDNSPLVGATLFLSGTQTAQTTTDANGRYSFANLASGGNYTISPSVANYTFNPVNRQYSNLSSNVSNADFTAISAPSREVQIVSGIASPGQNGIITVELVSQGNEHSIAFSLSFDSSLVFNPQVVLGSGTQAATLVVNNSQTDKVGISLTLPAGQTFAAGTHQLAVVTFNTAVTNAASTPINFDDAPTVREVLDVNNGEIQSGYVGGAVFFQQGYEADVSPRPSGNGNGTITVADFTQIGRFVAGLDTIPVLNVSNEFQRADSAPLNTKGNGVLSISDFTQAGRYAAGLDAINSAGGASQASLFEFDETGKLTDESLILLNKSKLSKDGTQNFVPTIVRVVNAQTSSGQQVTVSIETDANGTENGFGFSINYDANKLSNPFVQKGLDTQLATLIPNINQTGKIGVVLAMPFGQAIQAGTKQLVTIRFDVAANATGGLTPLTFSDLPVFREVSDVNATVLQSNFQDGNINILAPTATTVTIGGKVSDANGNAVARARVSITLPNGETRYAMTSSFGFYRFDDIAVGESYVVNVGHKTLQFSPQIIAVFEAMENVNFTALE